MNEAIKLKPCPFCGHEAELKDHGKGTGGWMISCKNHNNIGGMCGVLMVCPAAHPAHTKDEIHESGKANTIEAWNRRKAPLRAKPCVESHGISTKPVVSHISLNNIHKPPCSCGGSGEVYDPHETGGRETGDMIPCTDCPPKEPKCRVCKDTKKVQIGWVGQEIDVPCQDCAEPKPDLVETIRECARYTHPYNSENTRGLLVEAADRIEAYETVLHAEDWNRDGLLAVGLKLSKQAQQIADIFYALNFYEVTRIGGITGGSDCVKQVRKLCLKFVEQQEQIAKLKGE